MADRPARPRWGGHRSAADGTTRRRTADDGLGTVPDDPIDSVPDDPSAATARTDQAIRRALGSLADEWVPGPTWTAAEEDVAVRRLLAEARHRSHRRAAIAAIAAVAIGIGLVGVVGGLGSGGPRTIEAASRARPAASDHGDQGTGACVLVQVGAAPATCAGLVTVLPSNGTGRTNGTTAAPSEQLIGQATAGSAMAGSATAGSATAGSATAAAPGSSGPIDFGAAAGPSSSTGSSDARSLAAVPVAPSDTVVLRVGASLRVVLPARPGVVWTYPAVHSTPAGSAAAASGVTGSDGAGTASARSGAATPLRRVSGSDRSVGRRVTARFVARNPGTAVLVAFAAAPCRPTDDTCAAPRWWWQVRVVVLSAGTHTGTHDRGNR